jgi:PEP-CTERM motif
MRAFMGTALVTTFLLAATASARTVTLLPSAAAFTRGYIEDFDSDMPSCDDPRIGPFSVTSEGAGDGDIGLLTASSAAPFEDVRGNWEFELAPQYLRPTASARLKFLAVNAQGSDSAEYCVAGYSGDGSITIEDYQPAGRSEIAVFATDQFEGEGGLAYFYRADLDVTALLRTFRGGGPDDFLGISIAANGFEDANIDVYDIRLEISLVPEPAAFGLVGLGLLGLGTARRRSR